MSTPTREETKEMTLEELTLELLLDVPLANLTPRALIDILERSSTERQELAGVLRDIDKALMALELGISNNNANQMELFRDLRETFNRIPTKWMHK